MRRGIRHCGLTWYCRKPGREWNTDPVIGWSMEWRTGSRVEGASTGWHLYGGGHDGEWLGRHFGNALGLAYELYRER